MGRAVRGLQGPRTQRPHGCHLGARCEEDAGPGHALQARLLHALEKRAVRPLGAVRCHFEWGQLGRRIADPSAGRHRAEARRLFAELGMSSTITAAEGDT